jgi:hypothetical protein
MAPQTRSSQMGGPNVRTHVAQNENQIPFQASNPMGMSTHGKTASASRNIVHQNIPVPGMSNPLWE